MAHTIFTVRQTLTAQKHWKLQLLCTATLDAAGAQRAKTRLSVAAIYIVLRLGAVNSSWVIVAQATKGIARHGLVQQVAACSVIVMIVVVRAAQ